MNEQMTLTETGKENSLVAVPAPDAKQLRTEQIGHLLDKAYAGASSLKLKAEESKQLRADFPDEVIEIRPHDGIIYISHIYLRERLWDVFGPGQVAEICRERMVRTDSNEIAVDLVLLIRGVFVAEGIGTAKYYPNNPKGSFGDTVESAWSDALRRCCKKFGVGTQIWRPQYIRDWQTKYGDKRIKERQQQREISATPRAKKFEVAPIRKTSEPETDADKIPF